MSLKQPRSGESFATKLAFMVEVVSENVHAEGWHADIHFAANVTLFCVGRVETPMSLSVSAEVAAGCIVFTTVSTSVLWLLHLIPALFAPAVSNRKLAVAVGCCYECCL